MRISSESAKEEVKNVKRFGRSGGKDEQDKGKNKTQRKEEVGRKKGEGVVRSQNAVASAGRLWEIDRHKSKRDIYKARERREIIHSIIHMLYTHFLAISKYFMSSPCTERNIIVLFCVTVSLTSGVRRGLHSAVNTG